MLSTMNGVFPFLRYDLEDSPDGQGLNLSIETATLNGYNVETDNEVCIEFLNNTAHFVRVPLESDTRYMNFGFGSLIQLFVFMVAFLASYLGIGVRRTLGFFFNDKMEWKEFFRFVLDSNTIDSTQEGSCVYVYKIGMLAFHKDSKSFTWTDYQYNEFSYKVDSEMEALFVISFVLGFIQATIGHDLMVSNLIEPDDTPEPLQPQSQPSPAGGLSGDFGGMGAGFGPGTPGADLGGFPGGTEEVGDLGSGPTGEGLPEPGTEEPLGEEEIPA